MEAADAEEMSRVEQSRPKTAQLLARWRRVAIKGRRALRRLKQRRASQTPPRST